MTLCPGDELAAWVAAGVVAGAVPVWVLWGAGAWLTWRALR